MLVAEMNTSFAKLGEKLIIIGIANERCINDEHPILRKLQILGTGD